MPTTWRCCFARWMGWYVVFGVFNEEKTRLGLGVNGSETESITRETAPIQRPSSLFTTFFLDLGSAVSNSVLISSDAAEFAPPPSSLCHYTTASSSLSARLSRIWLRDSGASRGALFWSSVKRGAPQEDRSVKHLPLYRSVWLHNWIRPRCRQCNR